MARIGMVRKYSARIRNAENHRRKLGGKQKKPLPRAATKIYATSNPLAPPRPFGEQSRAIGANWWLGRTHIVSTKAENCPLAFSFVVPCQTLKDATICGPGDKWTGGLISGRVGQNGASLSRFSVNGLSEDRSRAEIRWKLWRSYQKTFIKLSAGI